ncbi:MAG TPA: hypothetical protein VGV17_03145 [Bosea sp. (in: a-proteobacteria)]|jgi:hypothetical protein|uniref:hypothetical protein n=1 Tax=Bosea sp. (in: a-proteobacteria) TaxID=1871050 RepID=UPI002DDD1290|nr:hypothetical protein [Bosea sp. (in: a-proteobacteria)]HEV2552742.1 hypothetical protein [Bosea sp. (in: a-proteobacteria)]
MSGAAILSAPAAAMGRSREPQHRPITLAMRVALGLAHTGVLMREPDGHWRCRSYPQQRVLDVTVRGMLERGLVEALSQPGLRDARECVQLTESGRARVAGGPLSGRTPPPVPPDVVLAEIEEALRVLDRESKALGEALLRESALLRDCARIVAGIEARTARLAATRESLDVRRAELRAIVSHAAQRMMETLQEGGL